MFASVAATVLFGFGVGFSIFIIAWSLNRLVQSMGWGALVKITSNWFRYDRYGTVMGIPLNSVSAEVKAPCDLRGLVGLDGETADTFLVS